MTHAGDDKSNSEAEGGILDRVSCVICPTGKCCPGHVLCNCTRKKETSKKKGPFVGPANLAVECRATSSSQEVVLHGQRRLGEGGVWTV